jgi:organic radical activating enzyme
MHKLKAEIVDIFSSIQGEGIFLGAKQIFVRFRRCNLACSFCDEAQDRPYKEYTSAELLEEVLSLDRSDGPHHSVSLTGGEPLIYTEFLKIFLRLLHGKKIKSYLETNGTLPDELSSIIEFVDIVAMDFKLPSSTLGRDYWREHADFLKVASKKKVFVKAVVTPDTTEEDIEKAADIVKQVKANIPFILQPATPTKEGGGAVVPSRLMRFLDVWAGKDLDNIRVIPQIHKILKVK